MTKKLPPELKRQRGRPARKLPPPMPGPDPEDEPADIGGNGSGEAELAFQPELPFGPPDEGRPVGPRMEASRLARFESPVPDDTLVVAHETYENLGQFFANIPNRERFEVQVWSCDPLVPSNQRKREWKGRIPLPTSTTLEEAIDREYGGGVYYWRLGCENRHASREDLPADYQAMPMTGYVRLGTPPKEDEPEVNPQLEARLARAEGAQNELLGFLKEMVRENKTAGKADSDAMTKLMTVVLTANQQQMQLIQSQATSQQQFLMAMLAMSEKKASDASEKKENMMELMMEAIRGEASGDKPISATLIEQLPKILEGLSKVPALSQPSPRMNPAPAAPPPIQVRAPAVQAAPAPVPAPAPAQPVVEDYPTQIAKRCIDGWQDREAVNVCADAIEELGTDENFNDLLDTPDAQVLSFLAVGFKAANNIEAPHELLTYAGAVLLELRARYPEEDAAAKTIAMTPAPAPAPAPAQVPVQVQNPVPAATTAPADHAPAQSQAAG